MSLAAIAVAITGNAESTFFNSIDVFDGSRRIEQTNVLVVDGKIDSVGAKVEPLADSVIVEGKGRTLLPGLIDCHTHTYAEQQLRDAIAFGVTTELDMMSMPRMAAVLRQRSDDPDANPRADFFSAGAAVTVSGGHGTQFGFPVPTLDNPDDAAAFVAERVREGSDYIKLIYEDRSAYGLQLPTLSEEMFRAAVTAAHDHDKLAVAHISTAQAAELAIEMDVDGLVHLFCDQEISDQLASRLKAKGLFVVPTATVVSNASGTNLTDLILDDAQLRTLITTEDRASLTQRFPQRPGLSASWQTLQHNIAKLNRLGVPILVGSDAPNPGTAHGISVHHELRLLVQCGLTESQALAAATALPAKHFELTDRGRIAAGMIADLLLVEGDPTRDIRQLAHIVGIWKAGRKVDRSERLQRVAKAEASNTDSPHSPVGTDKAIRPISDFEDQRVSSEFGRWLDSTDAMMGGTSTVRKKVVAGGAAGTEYALEITGKTQSNPPAFSGVMFTPAAIPMQPADLRPHLTISFWATGEERSFDIMLFTRKRGFQPSSQTFETTDQWKQYRFDFSQFDSSDGSDVTGIWIGSSTAGKFQLRIDQVQLHK